MSDQPVKSDASSDQITMAAAGGYVVGFKTGFKDGFRDGFGDGYDTNNSAGVLVAGVIVGAALAVWGFLALDSRSPRRSSDGK